MTTVQDIYNLMEEKAPFSSQMSFDNSGHLVGDLAQPVSRVLIALDITEAVVAEAIQNHCQLILAHHPVIFTPMKGVTRQTATGRIVMDMILHGISAICCHTNLDMAEGGVNDCLAEAIGLIDTQLLAVEGTYADGTPYGIGRVGNLPQGPCSLEEFLPRVKKALQPNGIRFVDAGKPVFRVAVGGGACGEYLDNAIAHGCDTFLTSDLKYHGFWEGKEKGINLVDAGHYPTENVVCPRLALWLEQAFPGLEIKLSEVHEEVFRYL